MSFCRIASRAGISAIGAIAFAAAAWSAPVDITTGSTTNLGQHLTQSNGKTLYLFTADSKGKSTCESACAKAWPPVLTTEKPSAGAGVNASLLGTMKRGNQEQVTYDGMPLYRFVKDKTAGAAKGEGITHFGGTWYVVAPDGKAILPDGKQKAVGAATG